MVRQERIMYAHTVFVQNREELGNKVPLLERKLQSRWNQVPILGDRRKKRIESQLGLVKEKIALYRQVEDGLLNGDTKLASTILREEADRLQELESPLETALRVARAPTAMDAVRNSPFVIAEEMRTLAYDLEGK